ncbi:MAG: sigma-70 family RNA polymerase sigma factor [Candidatus Aminicenantes bacterium]|nr:sigma-70 family RNA polymerase sigma factor [Candidatus Aminicenantes bacterium]
MENPETQKRVSDEELARKAKAGSRSCFEELMFRYNSRLFHFLKVKTETDEEAEDLVQETFLKAYKNLNRFTSEWKFSTWIYTTANRLSISHHRAYTAKKRQFRENPLNNNNGDNIQREMELKNIWHQAKKLRPEQHKALWLRYGEEMSIEDIARILKKNKITIRVLLHRARQNLAQLLNLKVKPMAAENPAEQEQNLQCFDRR